MNYEDYFPSEGKDEFGLPWSHVRNQFRRKNQNKTKNVDVNDNLNEDKAKQTNHDKSSEPNVKKNKEGRPANVYTKFSLNSVQSYSYSSSRLDFNLC